MTYCVVKNSTAIIDCSFGNGNTVAIMFQNARNAGLKESEVEMLSKEEYQSRKALEPQPPKEPTEIEKLQQENQLLKAQVQANADRADFQEDLIVEMAMMVYS